MKSCINCIVFALCVLSVAAKPSQRISTRHGSQKEKFNAGDLTQPTCPRRFTLISPDHTACLYPPKRDEEGVAQADASMIVRQHNYYRGNVEKYNRQPPARNMEKMIWDKELADLAQKWASNCIWRHEEVYNRNLPGSYAVGQNLARGFANWKSVLEAWHSEVNHFEFGYGSTNKQDVGHYTQMVWATSNRIGCGYAVCNGSTPYFACNYGPSGNFANIQYTPYTKGTKGSSCSRSNYNSREGLCDCGGKVCKNGGKLDLQTCTCKCKSRAWIQKDDCSLDCSKAKDFFICKHAGGSWGERECKKWANMPYDYCPITCHLCPAPGDEKNFWEIQQDSGELGDPQKQPETDVNETVDDTGDDKGSKKEQVETTPAPTPKPTRRPMQKPTRPPTTTTTKKPQIDDGLEDCTFVDLAKCGQPSDSYWPKHYCKYGIWRRCPAMCGKCAATKCQDYKYNTYKLGDFWVNEYGKFTCTRNGVVNDRGCLIEEIKHFIPGGSKHAYYDGKYTWTCHCDATDFGLTCKGKWGNHV